MTPVTLMFTPAGPFWAVMAEKSGNAIGTLADADALAVTAVVAACAARTQQAPAQRVRPGGGH